MEGRPLGALDGGERMPWLDPVDPPEPPRGHSPTGKLLVLVVGGMLLVGAAAGGWFWFSGSLADAEGHGELIAAPPGDYKVKAPEPGGMEVEGEGDSAFPTSEGEVPNASLDLSAIPEAPIVEPKARNSAPTTGAATPADASASTIQLGAFSSEKAASDAWKALARRFTYLEPLAFSVVPFEQNDRTLYRLRASGPGAGELCNRLRIAGEACMTIG